MAEDGKMYGFKVGTVHLAKHSPGGGNIEDKRHGLKQIYPRLYCAGSEEVCDVASKLSQWYWTLDGAKGEFSVVLQLERHIDDRGLEVSTQTRWI
ncbi:hypothetical protein Tco_0289952 [Tanacetum coccineum]